MIRASDWLKIAAAVGFTGIGLAVGWSAAPKSSGSKPAASSGGHGHSHGEPEPEPEPGEITPATLEQLGVTIETLEPREFVVTQRVLGTIKAPPEATTPVFAPIGGFVDEVLVRTGDVVKADMPLVRIVRENFGRVTLTLTADILQPAQEERHEAVVAVRRAAGELEIARAEFERVSSFAGEQPVVPRDRQFELKYAAQRAQMAFDHARHELARHGLSPGQVQSVIDGGHMPPVTAATWQRALVHNGLWSDTAETILEALPEAIRDRPWTIATLGELAASDRLTPAVSAWLLNNPKAMPHLETVGALLQAGSSLADLDRVSRAAALGAMVDIRPSSAHPDWDVVSTDTRAGARVSAGSRVATLRNSSRMWLILHPEGREVELVRQLAAGGTPCVAEPLIPDAGPTIEDALVSFVDVDANGRPIATVELPNQRTQPGIRTWSLVAGLRYVLRAPVRRFESVYVLPREALLKAGSASIVLIQHDDHFDEHEVVTLYDDADWAIVRSEGVGSIPPGSRVVTRAAFALKLALSGGDNDAAGHGHSHGM